MSISELTLCGTLGALDHPSQKGSARSNAPPRVRLSRMKDNTSKSNKTDGFDRKPVRVETRGNKEIDAVHHVVNDQSQLLQLYINERAGGIDLSIPLSNVAFFARSTAGNHVLTSDSSDSDTIVPQSEEKDELAADGGDI